MPAAHKIHLNLRGRVLQRHPTGLIQDVVVNVYQFFNIHLIKPVDENIINTSAASQPAYNVQSHYHYHNYCSSDNKITKKCMNTKYA